MATKAPPGKRRKKRKLRLSLKSSKLKKSDTYSDQVGWSTDVGKTLTDAVKEKGPDTLKHQCEMCGTIMKVKKPKKAKYTITCPHCEHEQSFS
jgi:rubrerythrin